MGRPVDKEAPAPEQAPGQEGRAGRVVVDNRGRNIWQWARAAMDSTSILLKRLENTDLAIEPTQKVPVVPGTDAHATGKPSGAKQAAPSKPAAKPAEGRAAQKGAKHPHPTPGLKRRDTGGGFDPYNSR